MSGPGVFWGLLIVFWGLILVIKQLFNMDFPVGRVMIGVFLVLLGIKLLFFRTHHTEYSDSNNIVFGNRDLQYNETENEYNIVFGSSILDLRDVDYTPGQVIEVNTVFGETRVLLNQETKVDINTSAVFGSVDQPRQEKLLSQPDSVQYEQRIIKIKATAVFGKIKFEYD